ncbi:hypothetical protein LCGC14_2417250 [marine sediment metagenome]|uniref:DUF669 domain-containing protein n=1 Tax=marine sediment metagenome TaxID=412755 RepID=A0A0F9E2X5_9ZZZZ
MPEVDFASLLGGKAGDAERPVPLPAGTYTVQVQRNDTGTSSRKGTPYVRIFFKILAADDDVDKGALGKIKNLPEKEFHDDFYLTPASEFMLADFLEKALKLKNASGRTYKDLLAEIKGKRAKVFMKQEPTNTGNIRSTVDRWLPTK